MTNNDFMFWQSNQILLIYDSSLRSYSKRLSSLKPILCVLLQYTHTYISAVALYSITTLIQYVFELIRFKVSRFKIQLLHWDKVGLDKVPKLLAVTKCHNRCATVTRNQKFYVLLLAT